jgi:hypothetical protein
VPAAGRRAQIFRRRFAPVGWLEPMLARQPSRPPAGLTQRTYGLDFPEPGCRPRAEGLSGLLRDECEAIALVGDLSGDPSSQAVRRWLEFIARPTGGNWYRAHNASIVAGYLEHERLAHSETAPERFFMNVALARVLCAHALVAAPRLALGRFAALARVLGDPRLGMAGAFLSLRQVVPNRHPLARDVEWSAQEIDEPCLLELVRDGNPIYAWPFEERHVWRAPHMRFAARVLERVTRARRRGHGDW